MKRVEDQPLGTIRQPDQKMPRECEPDCVPALGAAGMHVEDSERHRQALPPVDDAHQIGVLQVVIGQLVAGITIFEQDDLVERTRARRGIAAGARVPADIPGEHAQMLATARPEGARTRRAPMPLRRSARPARPTRLDRAESVCTSPGRSLPAARSFPFISELLHFDSRRWCGGRGVRSLRTRSRGLSRRYRLGGDGFARPDLDIGNHPLDAGYAPRVFGNAIEFGLRARRADHVDRAVDRFDRVIDRANLTVEREFGSDLSGNPRVFGALPDALARRHFDLVVNYS